MRLAGVPEHVDVYRLCDAMEDQEGVTLIHDVHVWTISSGYEAITAHVLVDPGFQGTWTHCSGGCDESPAKTLASATLSSSWSKSVADCSEDHHVDHLMARSRTRGKKHLAFLPFYVRPP